MMTKEAQWDLLEKEIWLLRMKRLTYGRGSDNIKVRYNENRDPKTGRYTFGALLKELRQKIRDGVLSSKLSDQKYRQHITGTMENLRRCSQGDHPSLLSLSASDAQAIIDHYTFDNKVGKRKVLKNKNGEYRIWFSHENTIGEFVNRSGVNEGATHCAYIHFGRKGAHIVPTKEGIIP